MTPSDCFRRKVLPHAKMVAQTKKKGHSSHILTHFNIWIALTEYIRPLCWSVFAKKKIKEAAEENAHGLGHSSMEAHGNTARKNGSNWNTNLCYCRLLEAQTGRERERGRRWLSGMQTDSGHCMLETCKTVNVTCKWHHFNPGRRRKRQIRM